MKSANYLLEHQKFALGATLFGWTLNQEESFELLDHFYFELGQSILDTADSYSQWKEGNQGGESEEIIGKWLTSRKVNRSKVFICSKVGRKSDRIGYSPGNISRAVDESLNRLQTDYIDMLYIHSSANLEKIDDTVEVLAHLIELGRIRQVGLSNFNIDQITDFSNRLHLKCGRKVFAVQNHYNLLERDSDQFPFDDYSKRTNLGMASKILPYLKENAIYNFSYHSLCRGVLSDFAVKNGRPSSQSLHEERTLKYFSSEILPFLQIIKQIAESTNTTVSSLALSWLRQEYKFTIPIISCKSIEQLNDSSSNVVLSEREFLSLDVLHFMASVRNDIRNHPM